MTAHASGSSAVLWRECKICQSVARQMRDCQHKTIEKKLPRIETSSIVANSFPSVVVSFTQANLSVPTHSGQTQNVNTAFGEQSLESYAVEARDYSLLVEAILNRELVHLEFSPLPRTKCAFSWSKLEPLEYLELQLVRCGMHDDRKQRSTIIMKVVRKRDYFSWFTQTWEFRFPPSLFGSPVYPSHLLPFLIRYQG